MKQILLIMFLTSSLVACGKFNLHTGIDGALLSGAIGLPSELQSTMSVNGPFLADGSSPADVRITVLDNSGNPVANVPVSLSVSGDHNVVIPCTPTDAYGRSRCTVYSTAAESKSFVAQISSTQLTQSVSFALPGVQRAALALVSSGDSQTASGGQVILTTSGANESPLSLQDTNGVTRVFTSILAAML